MEKACKILGGGGRLSIEELKARGEASYEEEKQEEGCITKTPLRGEVGFHLACYGGGGSWCYTSSRLSKVWGKIPLGYGKLRWRLWGEGS